MALTPKQPPLPRSEALNTATVSTTTVSTKVTTIVALNTKVTKVVATVTVNGLTVLTPEAAARTSLALCRWALVILIQRRRPRGSP